MQSRTRLRRRWLLVLGATLSIAGVLFNYTEHAILKGFPAYTTADGDRVFQLCFGYPRPARIPLIRATGHRGQSGRHALDAPRR